MFRFHRFLVLTLLFLTAYTSLAQSSDREYILLSGGPALIEWEKWKAEPHDRWWGNFIRAARVRIEQLRKQFGPQARITWLVYKRGYERRAALQDHADLISNILSVRDKYGVKLIWFNETAEVINYLNQGLPRDQIKIANFEFFGHSNRACFMFDYSNEIDSGSKVWLHENELRQLRRGIFTRDAFIKSWGCYTGQSMSRKFRTATGKPMIGAIGKTDYSDGHLKGWIPSTSRWTR